MNPETEAKAIIALIISLVAFGCGSGAGIVMGLTQNNVTNATQLNNTHDMPQIQSTKNVNINQTPQTTSNPGNTNTQQEYVTNNSQKNNDNNNNVNNNNTTQTKRG